MGRVRDPDGIFVNDAGDNNDINNSNDNNP